MKFASPSIKLIYKKMFSSHSEEKWYFLRSLQNKYVLAYHKKTCHFKDDMAMSVSRVCEYVGVMLAPPPT